MRLRFALSLLLSPLLLGQFAGGQDIDVVWYVSPGGSTNASSCGRTQSDPCAALDVVLSQSELFVVDGGSGCVSSSGDYDGRLSTTVYFMEGENFVPSICLSGWTNLRIAGQGGVMVTSSLGGGRGFFEFRNCSNVSIEAIHFSSGFVGRSTLYIENSRDISINDCIFPVTSLAGNGVYFKSCNGSVSVTNCLFFGDLSLGAGSNPAVGMVISQGQNPFGNVGATDDSYPQADFFIGNCTFRDIANGAVPNLSYQSAWGNAVGLLGVFYSDNSTVTIEGCTFTDLKNTGGSSIILRFESRSSNNVARLVDTLFLNNTALYGGGVAVYFISSFVNNLVEIENCVFTNNTATFEGGGVHVVSLSSQPTDLVRLRLRKTTFRNNEADFGAGVFIFNDPSWFSRTISSNSISLPLMSVEMEDCVFMNCSASVNEAAVNTLRVKLTMLVDNTLTGSTGSAVVLRSSVLVASGTLTFTYNKALNGAALRILERSRVNFIEVTKGVFQFNEVIYAGGAVYADEDSTTVTSNEYNHTLSSNVLGVCFMEFRNSFSPLPISQIIFSNNTATYGNDMFVYNLRSCMFGNFLPKAISTFLTGPMDYAVVYETDDPLSVISTGPSFLFFYGASTKCYKPVGNVTFLLPNCSHELLMNHFYTLPELQDGLQLVLTELDRFSGPGAQLHPTIDKLILPWSGIETSWSQASRLFDKEPNPGQLLLSPAPGEQFDLTIQLGDQLLNFVTGTVYVEVYHVPGVSPGVLMQINGVQFAYTDRIYFTPNRVLSGLALVGLVGTEGTLIVGSMSQIKGRDILLEIPFKLSPCHLGYYDPVATTIDEVDQLILTNYSFTMRIPTDQQLSCICYTRTNVSFDVLGGSLLSDCIIGYTVELSSLLWAGLLPPDGEQSVNELTTIQCPSGSASDPNDLDSFAAFLIQERARQNNLTGARANPAANPTDVAPYLGLVTPGGGAPIKCYTGYNLTELVEFKPNAVFSVDLCTRGFCRADRDWFLSDVTYPCVENRQGPLCGQCRPGLALTVTTTVCKDCSNPMWYIPLLTTLFCGLVIVIFVVVFNLGVFPTLDSMLFFVQAVYIIVSNRIGYRSFQALGIFNLDFTFDVCITSDFNALQRLVLQYITPLYIMILLSGVVCLTKVKGVSKYLGAHSYLQAMWLIVLVSYLTIANSSFEILHCRFIGPADDSRLVLAYDAAIRCWSGQHLPWAILAVCLVVFVILPFPIYVGVAIRISKLKPITDVYTSVYNDSNRYWVVYTIIRRLIFVIIGVFAQNFIYRHLYLLLSVLISLLVVIYTWPYRSKFDNYFAGSMLMALVLFMIVTMPTLYTVTDPLRFVSWFIVAVFLVVSIYTLILEFILTVYSRRRKIERITIDKLYTDIFRPRVVNGLKRFWMVLWSKKVPNTYELEESTTVTYSSHKSANFSSYREPLLDSEPVFMESNSNVQETEDFKQVNTDTEERNSNSNVVTYSEV